MEIDKVAVLFAPQLVQKTINPSAGFDIANISAFVKRGGKKPFVVDFTSSMAELCGVVPSVFIDTCAAQ